MKRAAFTHPRYEAREELEEIVEFLRDPGRFSKLGGQIPKGALQMEMMVETTQAIKDKAGANPLRRGGMVR